MRQGKKPLDVEHAKQLIDRWGGVWFGPPQIIDGRTGHVVDGRTRLTAWEAMHGKADKPPTLTMRSDHQIAGALIAENHCARAARYIPAAIAESRSLADLASYLGDRELAGHYMRKSIRRTRSPHATAKRRDTLERIARLLGKAQETNGTISIADLRRELEPWLK